MSAIHPSRTRAPAVVLIALGLAMVIVALVQRTPVSAITGTSGPASVSVTPTSGLTDGQVVDVSATFAAGSVSEMRVHLCKPNAGISNTLDFDFDGANCSPFKVSPAADAEKFTPVAPAATSATILGGFKVGLGTSAPWTDVFDGTNTLTCDSTHPCDLVVQFQIVGGQSWFAAPLTFAGAPGTTTTTAPGTTTTTAPGTTTTTMPGTTTTTTAPGTTTTTQPATTTTTTTQPATTTTTTTQPATTTTTLATTTTTDPPATTTTSSPATVTTTTFPVVVGGGGAGTGTGGTGAVTPSGTKALALTGVPSRDLAAVALLLMAAGLFLLSLHHRRRAADR